jgi:hypothetical protein
MISFVAGGTSRSILVEGSSSWGQKRGLTDLLIVAKCFRDHESNQSEDGNAFIPLSWAFRMCGSEAGASFE